MFDEILSAYGLAPASCKIERLDSGLINYTWKISAGDQDYILQKINTHIFKRPWVIAENLELLDRYIKTTNPAYLFVAPLITPAEKPFVVTEKGEYLRMFPFIKNSHTINTVTNADEAYEAARQFGMFTRLFHGFDLKKLHYPLTDFHNLSLRIEQFNKACANADADRLRETNDTVDEIKKHLSIADEYKSLILNGEVPLRLIHHDTKISNVLFDEYGNGLCVIDLDTVMPGYFFSDVGDMMRTYLSPANEEEQDFSKIIIRPDFFKAICKGYMEQMGDILTGAEKDHLIFSGKFMIYMQAVRFLTDHLNNDIYYQTKYPGHNLTRVKNQLYFLQQYIKAEPQLAYLIQEVI